MFVQVWHNFQWTWTDMQRKHLLMKLKSFALILQRTKSAYVLSVTSYIDRPDLFLWNELDCHIIAVTFYQMVKPGWCYGWKNSHFIPFPNFFFYRMSTQGPKTKLNQSDKIDQITSPSYWKTYVSTSKWFWHAKNQI